MHEVFYWNCFARIKIALNDQNDTQAFVGISLELQHFLARKDMGLFLQGRYFPVIRINTVKRRSRGREMCGVRISLGCILRTGGRPFPHWKSSPRSGRGLLCVPHILSASCWDSRGSFLPENKLLGVWTLSSLWLYLLAGELRGKIHHKHLRELNKRHDRFLIAWSETRPAFQLTGT